MPKIVLSYRRSDSEAVTGRIFDRLVARYGRDAIFRDVDNIPLGVDFRHHIDGMLQQSDIVLVVIGPRWVGGRGEQARLANPTDPVRIEVATALRKGAPVIPILVGRTPMPGIDQLPEDVRDIAYRNGLQIDAGRDFDVHVDRLLRALDQIIEAPPQVAAPARLVPPPAAGEITEPIELPLRAIDSTPAASPSPAATARMEQPEPAVEPAPSPQLAVPFPGALSEIVAAEIAPKDSDPVPAAAPVAPRPEIKPAAETTSVTFSEPIPAEKLDRRAATEVEGSPSGLRTQIPRSRTLWKPLIAGATIGLGWGVVSQLIEDTADNLLSGVAITNLSTHELVVSCLWYGVIAALYGPLRSRFPAFARDWPFVLGLVIVGCCADTLAYVDLEDVGGVLADPKLAFPTVVANTGWAFMVTRTYRWWLARRLAAAERGGHAEANAVENGA
jgi:hypothetical protein